MAQNITLLGASYSDVPAVTLPKTGGGTAQFDDTTDANATAGDIASGKTAYVNGTKITGTASGGGVPTFPWVTSTETITIGSNSVTNMNNAKSYFSSYQNFFGVFLKTAPTTNNQVVAMIYNSGYGLRYRNGSISNAGISNSYDAKLVEGTEYVVWKK